MFGDQQYSDDPHGKLLYMRGMEMKWRKSGSGKVLAGEEGNEGEKA